MSDLQLITADTVRSMSYNELIALVGETNRIPGGGRTCSRIAASCFITERTRVLDIGCSTGATSIELATLTACTVVGIDLNPISVEIATDRVRQAGLTSASFQVGDASRLEFPDSTFDVVVCGNVTALVDDPERTITEYMRVLRNGGHLVVVPMYYLERPPDELLSAVRRIVGVELPVLDKSSAFGQFGRAELEATMSMVNIATGNCFVLRTPRRLQSWVKYSS